VPSPLGLLAVRATKSVETGSTLGHHDFCEKARLREGRCARQERRACAVGVVGEMRRLESCCHQTRAAGNLECQCQA
jgi:hypothetical protein